MKKKFVLIYLEDQNKFLFFNKFTNTLNQQNIEQIYITNRISIWLQCKFQKRICYLITNQFNTSHFHETEIDNSIEILSKQLSRHEAKKLYSDVLALVSDIFNSHKIDYCFLFNGSNLCSLAIKKNAKKHYSKLVYFELSNLKNKVFIDSQGVNTNSFIFNNLDLLKKKKVDFDKFAEWKLTHFNERRRAVVKQASRKTKITNWLLPIDWIGFWTFVPKNFNISVLKKIKEKISRPLSKIQYDKFNPDDRNFYFFPLQLDFDTQLLIDAKMNNIQGITKAIEIAKNENRILVIKFHPAEDYNEFIKEVLELRNKYKFLIVESNSYQLLEKADHIITINSTIGFEGKIIGKNVIFLGKSLYQKLSEELIPYYIENYLVNIEFFNNDKVNEYELNRVLERTENKLSYE